MRIALKDKNATKFFKVGQSMWSPDGGKNWHVGNPPARKALCRVCGWGREHHGAADSRHAFEARPEAAGVVTKINHRLGSITVDYASR